MPIYIAQGRFSREAVRGMLAAPEDRTKPVSKLFKEAGGKLIGWYLTFGEYDWLLIAEVPNEMTMAAASMAASAGGGVIDIKTTVAFTGPDAVKAFGLANNLAQTFKSAGQAGISGSGRGRTRSGGQGPTG